MPQLFQVLCCYKCLVFQVHQTKKSNKWQCKLCGEKQSIKRHYGLGTSKECRVHVQKLNGIRGEVDELKNSSSFDDDTNDDDNSVSEDETIAPIYSHNVEKKSKWSEYTADNETVIKEVDEDNYLNDTEVVLELPSKSKIRKNARNTYYKNKKQKYNEDNVDDDTSCENIDVTLNNTSKKITKFVPPTSKLMKSESSNLSVLKTNVNPQLVKVQNEVTIINSDNFYDDENNISNNTKDKVPVFKNPHYNKEMCIPLDEITKNVIDKSKNSKWEQFIDDNVDTCDTEDGFEIINQSNSQPLFSITEDSDLDNILDI